VSAAATTAQEAFSALSCPEAGSGEVRQRLLDLVEPAFARGLVAAFLESHDAELRERAPGLSAAIDDWLAGPLDFESVWAPPLAEVYGQVPDGAVDPVRGAAAVGLHVVARGGGGEWAATMRRPARLRMGELLLPPATRIRVDGEPGAPRIRLTPAGHGDPAFELLPSAGAGRRPRLLAREALPPACAIAEDVRALVVPRVSPAAMTAFEAAFEALDEHPDDYAGWVRRVVLEIVVLEVEGDGMRSGSNTSWPGVVYMSAEDPLVLADNLVHEASHQYFHVLARVEPVDDGSDEKLYFSPVAHRERPLSAILVAYHAFANVALLLAGWMRSGLGDGGYCEARLADVLPKLAVLDEPLRGNPALTDTGRALFEPLAERVAALA
jgi:HEXXH motif-containing protein